MKVLVFDTETTGLPTERNASIMDTEKWPYILQLSYVVYDTVKKSIIKQVDDIINIGEKTISPGSIAIHGITPEISREKGVSIIGALNKFNTELNRADVVVGHNLSFDKRMVMVECIRNNAWQQFTVKKVKKPEYCTMQKSTELCALEVTNEKGETYFKFPTLTQLYARLFPGKNLPKNLHNALIDVLICLRCYIMLEHPPLPEDEDICLTIPLPME
jgi:DNA polymerase III epsilon subunit-like protein